MFAREKKIKGYSYLYLVESVGEGKRTKQRIIRNLGRKDVVLANGGLERPAASVARLSVVADRGMISAATIKALEERQADYILGARERSDKRVRETVLDDQASFTPLLIERASGETQLFVKEVIRAFLRRLLRAIRANWPSTRILIRADRAKALYEKIYCRCGMAEHHNLAADRTSCTKATANQLRPFLHAGAYWLMWGLRSMMPKRSIWWVAQFDSLRLRLIKNRTQGGRRSGCIVGGLPLSADPAARAWPPATSGHLNPRTACPKPANPFNRKHKAYLSRRKMPAFKMRPNASQNHHARQDNAEFEPT